MMSWGCGTGWHDRSLSVTCLCTPSFRQLQFQAEDPQEGAATESCTPSPLRTLCTVGVNHATIAQMLQHLLCGPCRLQHLHVTRPSR